MKYAPKRNRTNGRWDFTIQDENDKPRPFGYCMDHFKKTKETGHHATPHDAVCCFLDFVMEHGLDYRGTLIMMKPCEACKELTMNCVTRNGELFIVLCREHAKPEVVKELITDNICFEVMPELAENPSDPTPESKLDIPGAFHEAVRDRNK